MNNTNLTALVIYKRSPLLAAGTSVAAANLRFRQNHACHYAALRKVSTVLKSLGITFYQQLRGTTFNHQGCGLIITVGGDGTFLNAARQADERQLILGVNSDPSWSVGQFCVANADTFEKVLKQTLKAPRFIKVYKLQASFLDEKPVRTIECLNDILVCHANPAAMSRYGLAAGRVFEEQRSSGVWFSSAGGSTGAIFSSGGAKLPLGSRVIQYKPRELYHGIQTAYKLAGGTIKPGNSVDITSRMPHGRVFFDGAHIKQTLIFGKTLRVNSSPHFIRLVRPEH
ncbi:MAG: NAD(+)/NADH kinase [Candidatus Omnitrophica bacterium]|nr:NAD(+)/NADH kinase [Candidatus Omnitrophota bacterium]